jgi:hypothetical protein
MATVLVVCGIAALVTAALTAVLLPNGRHPGQEGSAGSGVVPREADGRQ